ncbi:glycoside hydrolase family 30 protein [Bythopirellula polymerisocia]|uniref:O-Glycosyl hydrolase family 30 n=1 Tax=Bythopirellula polymerisocia TaxID=2528003 RepID=A0A5C6CY13_9BACT|nr:glycoside hydrolase family 30 protein [Bythopirellula polymerisocia]TWU29813.1 O-Glycosyl hydrolase family 30 [Bythopirellula polymerisocia]
MPISLNVEIHLFASQAALLSKAIKSTRVDSQLKITNSAAWVTIFLFCFTLFFTTSPVRCLAEDSLQVKVFETSRAGAKLKELSQESVTGTKAGEIPTVNIQKKQRFQEIIGFGGAFTESTAYVLNQLGKEKRKEVINAYFSPSGSNYSLTRTHINSCDFSLGNYAYANTSGDVELEDFSIEEDLDDLVPLIKDALAVPEAKFKIIASPWTAPPWMKDNDTWNGGSLKPEYHATWALYFSKYIQEYKKQGVPIWSVTVENEPLGNGAQWESMIFTPSQMADFIKNHLGPRFQEDGIDSKILIYDQNRDHLEEWVNEILSNPEVAKYVWGTAVHWYSSTTEWYPEVLNSVHEAFPEKPLIETEGCIDAEVPHWRDDDWYWSKEATDWGYDWAPEQDKHLHPKYVPVYRYARDMIGSLNSWLSGWVDWNLVLDDKGGPNHAKNWCIAPVLVKPETKEVYYTPLYYIMAHFSKFIRPGAIRLGVDSEARDLMVTACANPDGSIAVVALNQSKVAVNFELVFGSKRANLVIPSEAIQTILVQQ